MIGVFAGFFIVPLFALVQTAPSAASFRASSPATTSSTPCSWSPPRCCPACCSTSRTEHSAAVAVHRADERGGRDLHLLAGAGIPDALPGLDADQHAVPHRTSGLENIPDEGPAILVCNHVSFIDPLIILGSVRRPVRFVMYHNIFNIPLMSVLPHRQAIPIAAKEDPELLHAPSTKSTRRSPKASWSASSPKAASLATASIQPFRPGVEKALAHRPVPVVPMAVRGLWGSIFSRADSAFGACACRGASARTSSWSSPRRCRPNRRKRRCSKRRCASCAATRLDAQAINRPITISAINVSHTTNTRRTSTIASSMTTAGLCASAPS